MPRTTPRRLPAHDQGTRAPLGRAHEHFYSKIFTMNVLMRNLSLGVMFIPAMRMANEALALTVMLARGVDVSGDHVYCAAEAVGQSTAVFWGSVPLALLLGFFVLSPFPYQYGRDLARYWALHRVDWRALKIEECGGKVKEVSLRFARITMAILGGGALSVSLLKPWLQGVFMLSGGEARASVTAIVLMMGAANAAALLEQFFNLASAFCFLRHRHTTADSDGTETTELRMQQTLSWVNAAFSRREGAYAIALANQASLMQCVKDCISDSKNTHTALQTLYIAALPTHRYTVYGSFLLATMISGVLGLSVLRDWQNTARLIRDWHGANETALPCEFTAIALPAPDNALPEVFALLNACTQGFLLFSGTLLMLLSRAPAITAPIVTALFLTVLCAVPQLWVMPTLFSLEAAVVLSDALKAVWFVCLGADGSRALCDWVSMRCGRPVEDMTLPRTRVALQSELRREMHHHRRYGASESQPYIFFKNEDVGSVRVVEDVHTTSPLHASYGTGRR